MPIFEVIVLGCTGGPTEDNLSGYLCRTLDQKGCVCLDAGALLNGLFKAYELGNIRGTSVKELFLKQIKGYLISHCHLDHVLGLVVASQSDVKKSIYGLDHALHGLRDHLFNGTIWPNYGDQGKNPIGQYHYVALPVGEKRKLEDTSLSVEAFPLHHAKACPSTAFLLEYQDHYLLYFGDTARDGVVGNHQMLDVWKRVAGITKEKKLLGILLECSYIAGLQGPGIDAHLDTETHLAELRVLAELSKTNLEGLKVVVSHRKNGLGSDENFSEKIKEELLQKNDLGVEFIFPYQGQKILF